MNNNPNSARYLAVMALQRLERHRTTLDAVLEYLHPQINSLHRPDRALFHALVFGILRHRSFLDRIINQHSQKPPKSIEPIIRNLLRLGVFQIRRMDRIPDSAAVHTTVELAKQVKRSWAAGFVNGLLRSVTRDSTPPVLPDKQAHPARFIAARHSFPPWLIRRWVKRWGEAHTDALCDSINRVPPVTLRVNTLKTDRETLFKAIQQEAESAVRCQFSDDGVHIHRLKRPFDQWEAYRSGWFQVQSESAQLVSRMLDPQPGHHVWDACAGLGTKTAHIAQLMDNAGTVLASDCQSYKLDRLQHEAGRLGIRIIRTHILDLLADHAVLPRNRFDRILLDAPCSGLGVLQRNPDGKWNAMPEDVQRNSANQQRLIETVAQRLKSGGILVYAVCSLEPEETASVVHRFLQKHPEFDIFRPDVHLSSSGSQLLTREGFLKASPHPHGLDGFFAVALMRHTR